MRLCVFSAIYALVKSDVQNIVLLFYYVFELVDYFNLPH